MLRHVLLGQSNQGGEMGAACSTHGRYKKSICNFLLENLKGRDHLEDLGVVGRKILDWSLEEQGGKVMLS